MKGYMLIVLVLLAVLAIPLSAGHALGNTVSEFSAISILRESGKEEVPVQDVTAPYSKVIGIPPKPIPALWLPSIDAVGPNLHGAIDVIIRNQPMRQGGRRIKSGRH